MAEPFIAEVRIMSFNFAPKYWAQCNGQLLPINQNQALFSLMGTTYGGDGRSNFALPNLQGCTPIHMGNGYSQGQKGGQQSVTLTPQQLPQHVHFLMGSSTAQNTVVPSGLLAVTTPSEFYGGTPNAAASAASIGSTGGNQPHNNMQPSLVLNFCIALQGIFPSQT